MVLRAVVIATCLHTRLSSRVPGYTEAESVVREVKANWAPEAETWKTDIFGVSQEVPPRSCKLQIWPESGPLGLTLPHVLCFPPTPSGGLPSVTPSHAVPAPVRAGVGFLSYRRGHGGPGRLAGLCWRSKRPVLVLRLLQVRGQSLPPRGKRTRLSHPAERQAWRAGVMSAVGGCEARPLGQHTQGCHEHR